MLAVRMNVGELARLGIAHHKTLLVVPDGGADHLARIDRKSASNEPISTTGHSTRPATSSSRSWSSVVQSLCKASCLASVRMVSLRLSGRATFALSSFASFSKRRTEIAPAPWRGDHRGLSGVDAVDREFHDVGSWSPARKWQ